jgi:head decoration protein D
MGGFDIAVTVEGFEGNEDRRWLGTRKGTQDMRSITLDVSTFLPAHLADKGAIPSGTVLGKITATGLYGPYDNAASDGRQTAAGFLFTTTKVGTGTGADLATAADVGVALFWTGIIKQSKLPAFAGTVLGELDSAALVDLASWIRFEA